MTTEELANRCGASQRFIERLRSGGQVVPIKELRGTSGKKFYYRYTESDVDRVIALKTPRCGRTYRVSYGNERWQRADAPRPVCEKHNVACILNQIGESCDACPRERRFEEVGHVVCDTFEEISARYKEASK